MRFEDIKKEGESCDSPFLSITLKRARRLAFSMSRFTYFSKKDSAKRTEAMASLQ